jgi:hypothetical protein
MNPQGYTGDRCPWHVRLLHVVLAGTLVACASSGAASVPPVQDEARTESLPAARLECPTARGDCDGDPSNGCEADLSADPLNCRACGHACGGADGGGVCMAGRCALLR